MYICSGLKYKNMFDTKIKVDKVHEMMVNHLADYIMNNGLRAAVLGISGGIDSTVVAYILKDVEHELTVNRKYRNFTFVGISMPTETTNPDEFRISELVGRAFCKNFRVFDITDESKSITVPAVGQDNYMTFNDRIRLGNVKARLRMIHLYDLAKAYGGIVIGTDNYTEQVLGFSTIGGDALFDYCPIQKLWKTEVYELAYYYKMREIEMGNWAAVHALDESLEIKPQAGLGITASDMDEIGAPDYFAVDDILYNDEHGIEQPDKPYVETVLRRKRENAYKRNLPIIINREEIDNAE